MKAEGKRAPGRPLSEEAHAALLDAAWWRLLEGGYAALTVDGIAKAAGAGKQTLYRRWPNKAALVIEALAAKSAGRIDRPKDAAVRRGDLLAFLKAELAGLKPYAASLPALLAEAQANPQTAEAFRSSLIAPRQAALRKVLAAASSDPDIRDALVEAIDGAIWRRIFLAEPLDEAFAVRMARAGWVAKWLEKQGPPQSEGRALCFPVPSGRYAATRLLRGLRHPMKAKPAKPRPIITQVEDSGAAGPPPQPPSPPPSAENRQMPPPGA